MVVTRPLTKPIAAPTNNPKIIDKYILIPLAILMVVITPANPSTDPTDKSIPAVIITNVTPIPNMAITVV